MEKEKLHVKNMICPRCITVVSSELNNLDVEFEIEKLGEITVFNPRPEKREAIRQVLEKHGFELLKDKESLTVEQVKLAVIDLIHHNKEVPSNQRNSDYIAQRVGKSYSSLSKLFSKHENITIEKYTILQKIGKVKELLEYGELNLSEIASKLGYSSVHHLSSQFKSITGVSVNAYKETDSKERNSIDAI